MSSKEEMDVAVDDTEPSEEKEALRLQKEAKEWEKLSAESLIKAQDALKAAEHRVAKCAQRLDGANAALDKLCPPMTKQQRYRQYLDCQNKVRAENLERARLALRVEASMPGSPLDKALGKRKRLVTYLPGRSQ